MNRSLADNPCPSSPSGGAGSDPIRKKAAPRPFGRCWPLMLALLASVSAGRSAAQAQGFVGPARPDLPIRMTVDLDWQPIAGASSSPTAVDLEINDGRLAEAPIALIRGRFRFRLLIKAPRGADLQGFLRDLLTAAPKETGGVRVQVDVDPQSFL